MTTQTEPLFFYQNVAAREDLRDAANAAEAVIRDYQVETSMRLDIYQAQVNAEKNIKASPRKLNSEEMWYVENSLLWGKRDGLQLPEEEREKVKGLKKDLAEKEIEFRVSSFFQTRCVVYSRSVWVGKLWQRECMHSTTDRLSAVG